jgi:hypothetical protein
MRTPSHVYAAIVRDAIKRHALLDHLHLTDVLITLRNAGFGIDRKSGLLIRSAEASWAKESAGAHWDGPNLGPDGLPTWEGGAYQRIETRNRAALEAHFDKLDAEAVALDFCTSCGRDDDLVDRRPPSRIQRGSPDRLAAWRAAIAWRAPGAARLFAKRK